MARATILQEILALAWSRFKIIAAIIGDVQSRAIATIFYFTILVPFGLLAQFFTRRETSQRSSTVKWVDRTPISSDIEMAKRQG